MRVIVVKGSRGQRLEADEKQGLEVIRWRILSTSGYGEIRMGKNSNLCGIKKERKEENSRIDRWKRSVMDEYCNIDMNTIYFALSQSTECVLRFLPIPKGFLLLVTHHFKRPISIFYRAYILIIINRFPIIAICKYNHKYDGENMSF